MLTGITLRGLLQLALGAAMSGVIPFAAGIAFLGVHAIGERTWPRPTGSIRRAALVARSARDVARSGCTGSPGSGVPLSESPW